MGSAPNQALGPNSNISVGMFLNVEKKRLVERLLQRSFMIKNLILLAGAIFKFPAFRQPF